MAVNPLPCAPSWYAGNDFRDEADRARAVARARRPLAAAVARGLLAQNARLAPSPARDRHVTDLCAGAAAVVTGQQVGLFLGPLFNLYKAATAVRAAAELRAATGEPVVPVFWLQTEDHDLPEIAVCHALAAGGAALSLHLPADPADRRSIADRVLPPEVAPRLADLRVALDSLPHAGSHLDRLERHYRPGAGWAAAFAGVLAELFADDGLVILDPRDPAFAAEQCEFHAEALSRCGELASRVGERTAALQRAGLATPVHVRAGAPLAFFHPDGAAGPRFRLEPDGDGFRTIGDGRRFGTAELAARLRDDPPCFSTSALLRPLLQDRLLPTVAYVGGATEVAYFAQIAPLYDAFSLPMPLVVPRASFRWIDERSARLLQRWRLAAADCEADADTVLRRATTVADAGEEALGRLLLAPFLGRLEEVAPKLIAVDPDLRTAIAKTQATVEMAVGRLAGRYDRACRRSNERLVADVDTLTGLLFPAGQPQERFYGLASVAARWGERPFLARVAAAVEPFAGHDCRDLMPAAELPR